jgi:hypothetical protein
MSSELLVFRKNTRTLRPCLTAGARVRAALVVTAIAGAVIHPLTQALADQVLAAELSRQLQKLYASSSKRLSGREA